MIYRIDALTDHALQMAVGRATSMNRACCLAYLRNRGVKYVGVHPMRPPGKRFTQYFDIDAVSEPRD